MAVIQHDFRKKPEQKASSDKPETIPGYRLRIEIGFSSPPIWREVDVCGSLSLADLSQIIQHCFDWSAESSHRFLVGKIFYGPCSGGNKTVYADEAETQLFQLEEVMGFIFTYLHDHGGGWECEISLIQVFADGHGSARTRLHDAEGCSPPAGMDDIHEYNELLRQIEQAPEGRADILARHGIGADFDPCLCDTNAINSLFGLLSR